MLTGSGGDVGSTRRARLRVAARVHVGLDGGLMWVTRSPARNRISGSSVVAAGCRCSGKRARAFEADFHGSGRPAKRVRARAHHRPLLIGHPPRRRPTIDSFERRPPATLPSVFTRRPYCTRAHAHVRSTR